MNKENLLRMADYIETIPQEKFNMAVYRSNAAPDGTYIPFAEETQLCGTVGCVIGHCTVLDKIENLPRGMFGDIDFSTWADRFTGLAYYSDAWDYLFSGDWSVGDNTPTGAAKRIRYFVEHGLPENWQQQMNGLAKLSYNE